MKNFFAGFKSFALDKMTVGLLIFGFMYPLIMIGIYVPSYAHASDSMGQITVAIVNDDAGNDDGEGNINNMGAMVSGYIIGGLGSTFKFVDSYTFDEAMSKLQDKKVDLVVQIPIDFTDKVNAAKVPVITYHENGTAASMTLGVSGTIVNYVQNIINGAIGGTTLVNSTIEKINDTGGQMQNQIGPMFLVVASYSCGLMLANILMRMIDGKRKKLGRFKTLAMAQILGFLASFIVPLGGLAIFALVGSFAFGALVQVWLVMAFIIFASLQINLVCLYISPSFGSLFSIALMLTQLMASGAVISRAMMYPFIRFISYISPHFYAVEGIGKALFGGGGGWFTDLASIWLICAVLLTALVGVYALMTKKTASDQPLASPFHEGEKDGKIIDNEIQEGGVIV